MGSPILSLNSLEINLCNLSCSEHGSWDFHFTWVPNPSPKYDMDAYMAILFGGSAWSCAESWVKQKAILNSQHKA